MTYNQHPPLNFAARYDAPELLDSGAGSAADVAANLDEMACINRYLGGFSALTRHLYPRLAEGRAPSTVIDLGTGGGHLLDEIERWARRSRLQVRLVGVDWSARNLRAANRRGAAGSLVRAEAGCLPFPAQAVDYWVSTLLLHHLSPSQVIHVLQNTYYAARKGILMSDLVRGWLPYLAFKLVGPVFARHPFTRLDGALSVRRAYTPAELLALAHKTGLPNARVYTHWPWRMTLVALKEPDQAAGEGLR